MIRYFKYKSLRKNIAYNNKEKNGFAIAKI
jgi:hypothetical protein